MIIKDIINIYNILKKNDRDINDMEEIANSIDNEGLNVNQSLIDNISLIDFSAINNEKDLKKIRKIVDYSKSVDPKDTINNKLFSTPIYQILEENLNSLAFLLEFYNNGKLEERSVLHVLEELFDSLKTCDEEDLIPRLLFIKDIISTRRPTNCALFQQSKSIAEFVLDHDKRVFEDLDKQDPNYGPTVIIKNIVLQLLVAGYVSFDYPQVADSESRSNGYEHVIIPLMMDRDYGNLQNVLLSNQIHEKDSIQNKIVAENIVNCIFKEFERRYQAPVKKAENLQDSRFFRKIISLYGSFYGIDVDYYEGKFDDLLVHNEERYTEKRRIKKLGM